MDRMGKVMAVFKDPVRVRASIEIVTHSLWIKNVN